jgi:hypothetical protein
MPLFYRHPPLFSLSISSSFYPTLYSKFDKCHFGIPPVALVSTFSQGFSVFLNTSASNMPVELRRSTRSRSLRYRPYEVDYGNCPSKPIVQSKYFYAVGDARFAIANHVHPTSTEFPATPEKIKGIRFDHRKWQYIQRPANYHGPWPPTSVSQLMNTDFTLDDMGGNREATRFQKKHGEQRNEDCLGKFCWQEVGSTNGIYCLKANCGHSFAEWLTGQARWRQRLEIRQIPGMGYGLFSKMNSKVGWKETWKKDDILGAYLGELIPERTGNTDYCHEVTIGPEFKNTRAPVAYIDAEKCGSYVRFCNHGCESNAGIFEARVGKERVLALRATKPIAAGEQICIDYGSDYFHDRQCLCGSANCKYPDTVNLVT